MMTHEVPGFRSLLGLAVAACGLAAAFVPAAIADPVLLTRSTCTTLNCDAAELRGIINSHPPVVRLANHWVGQFSGQGNSCLRVAVTAQTVDLAMTVVAPDGTVFSNDDGATASCATCPKVVVAAARSGFYTVVVAVKGGLTSEAAFTLRAGLYAAGNAPNCNAATPPR